MVQYGLFQNPKILYRPEVFFLSCVLQDRRPDGQKVSLDNYLIGLARSRSKTRKFKNRGDMQYRSQFTASACSGTSSSSFKTPASPHQNPHFKPRFSPIYRSLRSPQSHTRVRAVECASPKITIALLLRKSWQNHDRSTQSIYFKSEESLS